MKASKFLQKILVTRNNISFTEMLKCIESFGFRLDRVTGSHHIFVNPMIPELVNLQNVKGKAKPYQIKQFLVLVEKHNLKMRDYHINIFYSKEDEGYIADIPDLVNCSAFGNTPKEALNEVLIAKELWIATAKENAKPIPQPEFRPLIYQLA